VSSPENPEVLAEPVMEAAPVEAAPAGDAHVFAAGSTPKLVVNRGLKQNVEYPVYEGQNFIGRADEKPVDIDLDDQEPPDRVWSSRQHALITMEGGVMNLEDLNSANGTFVNRQKVHPGSKMALKPDDVIQIGTVQLKVKA
jgi:pSer/pThr/pTyr-binding forkhead associated (FHA) protein